MTYTQIGEQNPFWGKHHTEKTKELLSKAHLNKGLKKNPTKVALHVWAGRRIKKPSICPMCKKKQVYDLANISQKYKRDLSDWEWLCRSCHFLKYHKRMGRAAYIRTDEHKKKMSKILQGRIFTDEHKKRLSESAFKRHNS